MAKPGTLKYWAMKATPRNKATMAECVGTSVEYLFSQLANGHRENPKVRFALKIVQTAEFMHKESGGVLPLITAEGLAWPGE